MLIPEALNVCMYYCTIFSDEPATVYMTYIYNPGYFFVQREDSFIDEMSEELQKSCQVISQLAPPSINTILDIFTA